MMYRWKKEAATDGKWCADERTRHESCQTSRIINNGDGGEKQNKTHAHAIDQTPVIGIWQTIQQYII